MAVTFYLFFVLIMVGGPSSSAHADQIVRFDYSQKGIAYNLARTALKSEYAEKEKTFGPVSMAIGRIDLNGDGTPEIIAVLNDQTLFCDLNFACPYFIFAYTKRGLVEIAKFRAAGFKISNKKTKGILDLIVYETENPNAFVSYKWDERSYKEEKK